MVTTEYHFHDSNDYSVNIEWLSRDDIGTLLRDSLIHYRQFVNIDENEQHGEQQMEYIWKMYRLSCDVFTSIIGSGWENDAHFTPISENAALKVLEESCQELMADVEKSCRTFSSEDAAAECLRSLNSDSLSISVRYLLKKVTVFIRAPVLRHGVVLVDLPGLRDVNAIGCKNTERYILECQEILAVCTINRATSSRTMADIFYLAKQAELRNVNIVVTKTDELDAREFKFDFPLSKKTFKNLNQEVTLAESRLRMLKDEMEHSVTDSEHHSKDDWVSLRQAIDKAQQRVKKARAELETFMVTTRNDFTAEKLRELFSGMIPDNDLYIFPVSSVYYRTASSQRKNNDNAWLKLSGILELRMHCMSRTTVDISVMMLQHMAVNMPSFLRDLAAWTEATVDHFKSQIRQEDVWRDFFEQEYCVGSCHDVESLS